MDIDFSTMQVGDRIALIEGKWGDAQRVAYNAATAYQAQHTGVQFQVDGHDGSTFERGQFWIERTK